MATVDASGHLGPQSYEGLQERPWEDLCTNLGGDNDGTLQPYNMSLVVSSQPGTKRHYYDEFQPIRLLLRRLWLHRPSLFGHLISLSVKFAAYLAGNSTTRHM
jgi:hypothetical protein